MWAVSHTGARPSTARDTAGQPAWHGGHRPGAQVAAVSGVAVALVAATDIALTGRLSLFYDLTFVVLCLVAALAVRPPDFFVVAVMPPALMLALAIALAVVAPGTLADPGDGFAQTVVSGLAHHAGGLAFGYATALVVLGLRQVALRPPAR